MGMLPTEPGNILLDPFYPYSRKVLGDHAQHTRIKSRISDKLN